MAPTQINEQVSPDIEEFRQAIEDLPERWLPHSEEMHSWLMRWLEAWNTHNLDALSQLVTEDIVWDDPAMFGETVHGRSEFRAFTESFFRAFPDVRFEPTQTTYFATESMGLAVPWRMTGTFTGELAFWGKRFGDKPPAFAPTGRRIDIEGVDLYEFRDGALARWAIIYDLFGFSRQLGLMPPADSRMARLQLRGQRLMARRMRKRARRTRR